MKRNDRQWFPVYVTRKTASGMTGHINITVGHWRFIRWTFLLNVTVWTIVGLIVAVRVVF